MMYQHKYHRAGGLVLAILTAILLTNSASSQPLGPDKTLLVCPLMHAKAMPSSIPFAAMTFTGPTADGRRGSAGFVVHSQDFVTGDGTRWQFIFQRDASGYGFQVIHPLEKGHVVVSVLSGVTIHRGGAWAKNRLGKSKNQRHGAFDHGGRERVAAEGKPSAQRRQPTFRPR